MSDAPKKLYIGDSVYAEFDGDMLRLTTANGKPGDPSNEIFLEPAVWDALKQFMDHLK